MADKRHVILGAGTAGINCIRTLRQMGDTGELLAETYRINGQRYLERVPYPTLSGIQNILNQLALRNPKAKQARPEQFVDASLVTELDHSGFIKQASGTGK